MGRFIHFSVGNTGMDCYTFGTGGKNLILIPGLDLKSAMLYAETVENAYSLFSDEFTVYLFERRKDANGITTDIMADDIALAMKSMRLKNNYIYGVSLGGMIAMTLALNYPELVSKLLVASSASFAPEQTVLSADRWIKYAEEGKTDELISDFIKDIYSDEFASEYGTALSEFYKNVNTGELKHFMNVAEAVKGFDIYDRTPGIGCPVFILGSEKDKVFPPECIKKTAAKIGCELFMYDNYGHGVYDEAPDFKDKIFDFFMK